MRASTSEHSDTITCAALTKAAHALRLNPAERDLIGSQETMWAAR